MSWENFKEWVLPILLVFLAALGGLIGSMIRMIDKEGKITWGLVAVETLASAFSGIIVMLLCSALGFNLQWSGVIVGVCGWFGGRAAMGWLEGRVRRIVEGESK